MARSLTTFAGAGVNQVAFATDDIFAGTQLRMAASAWSSSCADSGELL
jgi:4-hydroxyphenylpyruvate dioxygenase-like putative hemolysin